MLHSRLSEPRWAESPFLKRSKISNRPTRVKLPLALLLLLGETLAQAQTPENLIQVAFDKIRSQRSLFMRLEGTEQIANKQHHLMVDAFWDTIPEGEKIVSKVQVVSYKDDVQTYRVVGDGTSLWNLDLALNEYSVNLYGSYSSKQPDNYQEVLLQSLVAGVVGPASFSLACLETFKRDSLRDLRTGHTAQAPQSPTTSSFTQWATRCHGRSPSSWIKPATSSPSLTSTLRGCKKSAGR